MLNLDDLPIQLQPYYRELEKVNSEEEALSIFIEILNVAEKMPKADREKYEQLILRTPITYSQTSK